MGSTGEPQQQEERFIKYIFFFFCNISENNILWIDETRISLFQERNRTWAQTYHRYYPEVSSSWDNNDKPKGSKLVRQACFESNPTRQAFISLAECRTEGKRPKGRAGSEDDCSKPQHLLDVFGLQTSGSHWLNRIFEMAISFLIVA